MKGVEKGAASGGAKELEGDGCSTSGVGEEKGKKVMVAAQM